jgi:hypothetical protein
MTAASFQIARGVGTDSLSAGSQTVTEGTAAPTTANGIEVRVDVAGGWTKKEVRNALNVIWRFLNNRLNSTSIPL